MYCPECGIEEREANQFCRACGNDLRRVRVAIESPDSITASAVSARDEIGRAVAAKIRETQTVYDLKKVAEDVLPEIEKFLESPEEKRLRRLRLGMILSMIGIGTSVGMTLVALAADQEGLLFLAALGIVTFFIGLGFTLNGVLLTVPKKTLVDRTSEADSQRELDHNRTSDFKLSEPVDVFKSISEHTTVNLDEKLPSIRQK